MTDAVDAPAPSTAPKADPETLALRTAPGRVTRFRRGAIVGIAAAGSTAIVGVAWLALKPATLSLVLPSEDKVAGAKAPPDALAGAPTSYGDVPKLGPPLPGDLGRPILERQRQLGTALPADPAADATARAAQEAETERQRLAAEQKAARQSGVMLQIAGSVRGAASATPATDADGAAVPAGEAAKPTLDPHRDPNGQLRKNELVGRASRDEDANPHALAQPVSPWTLQAGKRLLATQAALDEIKAIVQMLVGRALEGDVNAASIVLAKVLPSVKAQAEKVAFDFDPTAPISEQVAQVLQAVSEGKLAADVGRLICDSIARLADVRATEELAARIEALEAASDARG